jgi:hypothetical protein
MLSLLVVAAPIAVPGEHGVLRESQPNSREFRSVSGKLGISFPFPYGQTAAGRAVLMATAPSRPLRTRHRPRARMMNTWEMA